jgi:predicted AAA+ superfamily ATPase
MITRFIEKPLKEALFQGKTLIIYGPRQVGKTTLLRKIMDIPGKKTVFYDAESASAREYWQTGNIENILTDLSGYDLVGIDEAQKIVGIGSMLKYLHDHLPSHIQIIATGSSSFDLAQKTRESMVGRVRDFSLMPFTVAEIVASIGKFDTSARLQSFLMYGMYPVSLLGGDTRREMLELLAGSLLYKDILEIDGIRKSQVILQLLRLLALQIGSTISYSELGQKLSISVATVQKYIYLLEESFIVFTLPGFSRNLRNEITKSPKIYFYDVGIRNALIANYNPPDLRTDI